MINVKTSCDDCIKYDVCSLKYFYETQMKVKMDEISLSFKTYPTKLSAHDCNITLECTHFKEKYHNEEVLK